MLQVIKCPSCAAPLECDGDAFEKCDFCGSQVAVNQNNVFSQNSVGFDGLLKNAHKLKEILHLARSGRKIEAIKMYRETFGVGLKEAKDAVDRLESGQNVSFQNVRFVSPQPIKINTEAVKKGLKIFGGAMGIFIVLGILGALASVGVIIYSVYKAVNKTTTFNTTPKTTENTKSSFAREVLRFGGEGNGAGKFTDNRTIAIDGEGKIYSADYQGGRVQVFDKDGKFLTQWFVKDREAVIYSLAANRKGTVFVTQPGKIITYEGSTGNILKEAKLDLTSALYPTLDGKIIAANRTDILLIDENLNIVSTFKNAAQSAGIKNGFNYLAVNGLGEVFATVDDGKDLVKFSADGKFVDRFKIKPSRIQDLAIDPKGRIFITDGSNIFVYQADGNLVDSFAANQCFALIFNDQGELLTATRPFVVKYAVNQ